jgi:hypothetical protein
VPAAGEGKAQDAGNTKDHPAAPRKPHDEPAAKDGGKP